MMIMMASDIDELDINPFYKALTDKFLHLFEKAQQNCYWICVPQSDSITSKHIDKTFTETHILRPSALFKGHFDNLCTDKVKSLRISDDGRQFTVCINTSGKGKEIKVKILNEELAYNKDLQPYKILILEKPLHPSYESKRKEKDQITKYLHTPKITAKECAEFLNSFVDSKQSMIELNGKIQYFHRHYMVLEDYLDDAADRIGDICNQAIMNVVKILKRPLNQDNQLLSILNGAVESYVMNALHSKVYPVVRQLKSSENNMILDKCEKLNKVKPEQIGVRKEFACPLPSAVVELANLGSLLTPREKLICLKATVDNTTQGVTNYIRESQLVGITLDSEPCITSDDLIPILVMVIAQAKCCYLPSDLLYIEHFMWEAAIDRDRDNLSYCLVTFKAAVQYMLFTDFSQLPETKSSHEKEISIEELMKAKASFEPNSNTNRQHQQRHSMPLSASSYSSLTSNPPPQPAGRLERQLSRISSLLEKASMEESTSPSSAQPQHTGKDRIHSLFPDRVLREQAPDLIPEREKRARKQNDALGGFLSSLQKDAFDQPFGKQS